MFIPDSRVRENLQIVDISSTVYLPRLANVVHERPLTFTYLLGSKNGLVLVRCVLHTALVAKTVQSYLIELSQNPSASNLFSNDLRKCMHFCAWVTCLVIVFGWTHTVLLYLVCYSRHSISYSYNACFLLARNFRKSLTDICHLIMSCVPKGARNWNA